MFLSHHFGIIDIPKVIREQSVGINLELFLDLNLLLGWLTRQDLIDIQFQLVLIEASK